MFYNIEGERGAGSMNWAKLTLKGMKELPEPTSVTSVSK